MCISMIGQVMFALIMFFALILTAIAFSTAGWRSFNVVKDHEQEASNYMIPMAMGLLHCSSPEPRSGARIDYCLQWRNNKPEWEKIVTVLLITALTLEIGSLVWVFTTFCACCCRKFWILFLPLTALLTTLSLSTALFMYAQNNDSAFEILGENKSGAQKAYTVSCFYSFYVACGALFLVAIDIIVGVFARKIAHICC